MVTAMRPATVWRKASAAVPIWLLPSAAGAGEAVMDGEAWGWIAGGMPALMLLAGVVVLSRRLAASRAAARLLAEAADRAGAILAFGGAAYFAWDGDTAAGTAGSGTARALGLPEATAPRFDGLVALLQPADAAAVADAVRALRAHGAAFERDVETAPDGRALRLQGRRVNGTSVVRIDDRRRDAETISRLESERDDLRGLIDTLPVPVWRRGPGLAIDYANHAYARAVDGASGDRGAPVVELGAGVVGPDGRALAEHARDTGKAQSDTHHVVIGGERRLVEITEVPLAGTGAIAGFALDRTAVEDAETELARHIAGHDEVLHNLGTAIAIYGADKRLLFFNTAFVRMWGLDEHWLRAQPKIDEVLEELHNARRLPEPANFPAFKAERRKLFTSLIEPREELMQLPDETAVRMVITPHPFGGLLFTWEDVTDKLALERSYNTLIAVQRETLDHLFEGVAVIGGNGRLKLSNPAFARIWQLSPVEIKGEPHVKVLVDQMRSFFDTGGGWEAQRDEWLSLMGDREPRSGRIERNDGTVLNYASVPLPDGDVLLIYIDISDSTRVERALHERNDALEAADQLKSEFIANVSYELRTPLNTIIGFAEILNFQYFGALNAQQLEYSGGILQSSQRLLSLINDILDLATIEAGHMVLERDTFDIRAALTGVLSLIRERARNKGVAIELDCPDGIGELVADERRLKQALFNLISNAVKFTPENGHVSVAARRQGDEIVLRFTDSGIGIPEKDRERVFGKFERGSGPEARNAGAGLGLSLVKSLIELHGGRIELDSEEGVGTTVTCHLPTGRQTMEMPRTGTD